MNDNPFVGCWTYRSLKNKPNIDEPFKDLEFARATLVIKEADFQQLKGTIGGDNWLLALHGSRTYGYPMQARFQAKGLGIGGEEWVYDYIAWLVPDWPNSNDRLQRPAMVGSVVRTVPHSSSDPNSETGIAEAGVVASFYAVRQD